MTSPTTYRMIDPASLSLAQRAGERCAVPNCQRRFTSRLFDYTRPRIFFGSLPDGSPVFVCPDHEVEEL